jgi:hypothetical protein
MKMKNEFKACAYLNENKMAFFYPDDDFSDYGIPCSTDIISDIDFYAFIKALGIKGDNLKWALERLPLAENDILRIKKFCDENRISYVYKSKK